MKLLFTLFFALLMTGVQAQSKKPAGKTTPVIHRQSPDLMGLGPFKINKTTPAIIDQVCKELQAHIQHIRVQSDLENVADSVVYALDYASIELGGPLDAEPCPQGKVFFLPHYEVAGIFIKGIVLKFHNNLLAEISIDEPAQELVDAFGIKYGKPESKIVTKPVPCVFTHTGNKITYHNETVTDDWNNGDVKAEYMLLKFYDSSCDEHFATHLTISSKKQDEALYQCSRLIRISEQNKDKQVKKKSLQGL